MNSPAWMNGQHRQVGHNSQKAASQLTHDTIWNQQDGTENNSCQYRTFNTGVQQPQGTHLFFHNGVYSNLQTSVVPQKTVSSQMPAGGGASIYYLKPLQDNLKNSFPNKQSGNPCLLVTDGCQVATQQDFHPNSGVISSSSQCPPNMVQAKTMYHQQDMSAHWNHQVTTPWKQSVRTQNPNVVSKTQNYKLLRGLLQNPNEELNKLDSAFKTTATSLVRQQEVCTSTLRSATAHNRQTAHNQNHTLTGTQHGIRLSPPSYHAVVSQFFKSKNLTVNSSTAENTWQFSSVNLKKDPRQNPVHHKSTNNNGADATQHFMSKTNEHTLNSAFDTQEQIFRQQKIARIVKDLQKSFDAAPENNLPGFIYSPHTGNRLVREVRMTGSHQNMQPVTLTVTEGYNSNSSQSLPLNSGLSLPKTTHSVVTRTQHSVNAPQQSSLPNVHAMTTSDGSRNGSKADDTLFSKNNKVSKGNLVELPSGASQVMKLTESILPQKNVIDLSGAKNHEVLEIVDMLSSVQANDSSVHSSPACTGRRAIAVVQPLSQERYQAGSKHTSSHMTNEFTGFSATKEFICDHEKSIMSSAVAKDKNTCLTEGSNQLMSSKSIISHSMASTSLSSSDSAEYQDLSQKQLYADDTGSKLSVNMQVDQQVTPPAQQSVTNEVLMNRSGDEDKNKNPTDPKARAFDLSSIPTIPWTAVTLKKLVMDAEKAQLKCRRDSEMLDNRRIFSSMFWNGNLLSVEYKLKTSWYKDLVQNVKEFCSKHVTSETVILSQVKYGFKNQLKRFYFLTDDEVYTEKPYKSSWLNINEQLDDIDKEFGFSWSLKNGLYSPESLSQSVEVGTVNSNHEQTANEFSNEALSQTELEPIVSGEKKQVFIVEAPSTQPVSSSGTDSVGSNDPYYTFEIQVLPPEEAKVIFEQAQTNTLQSNDTVRHPERVLDTSVEDESPEGKDVILNDLELENEVCPFEQVCCLSRLMEMFGGPNKPLSKCQCKNDQSLKDCTDGTLAKEDMAVEKEDKLCANMCDNMNGENQTKSGENVDHRIKTCSWLDLCNELSQTNALTEKDHKPHLFSDKEPKNVSQINLNSSQSSIVVISEDEDDPSRRDAEIQSDHEVDCVQDQIKSTRSTLSCTSFSSDKENKNPSSSKSKLVSQTSDPEDNCEESQLESTDVAESSFETKEQTKISTTAAFKTTTSLSGKHQTVEKKWKKQSMHTRFIPFDSKSNKRKNADEPSTHQKVLIDSIELKPIASNVRAVQLVLFGSAPEDQRDLIGSRRKQTLPQGTCSNGETQPPKVVSVKLSPLKRKSNKTVMLEEYSVKQLIYEKWKKSFPPAKTRRRGKLKMQKCTFASSSGVSPKKAETVGPTVTEKVTASSEMRVFRQSTKRCLSLKRRRSLSNGLKGGKEGKKKKMRVTLKQPSEQKQNNAKSGSPADTSLKESIVLRFTVLPSTSNFQDGSSDRNEANDPVQSSGYSVI